VRESLTQEREAAAYLDVFLETWHENSENAPSGNPASLSGE